MFEDIKEYIPKPNPDGVTLFQSSESDNVSHSLMEMHIDLLKRRAERDFSEPRSIFIPAEFLNCVPEGVGKFNSNVCSWVSVDDWVSEKLEREGVFPDCVCVDLDQYGTLPLALYDVLKKVEVKEVKDVLVGLPVWLMEDDVK